MKKNSTIKSNFKLFCFALVTFVAAAIASTVQASTQAGEYTTKAGFINGTTVLGLGNSYNGTLKAGIYTFSGAIYINPGDTLLLQSGVKLLSVDSTGMIVNFGAFVSLGTQDNPNWITGQAQYNDPATYKNTTPTSADVDPALKLTHSKAWSGIQCDTSATLLILKWTHIEFVGNVAGAANATLFEGAYAAADNLFTVLFQNPKGNLIIEDCWIYGTSTDALRCKRGKVHIMRNTVEKMAHDDGDAFNVKGGTVGDMAYNLFIGTAKGGTKAANAGQLAGTSATQINMYNNTYINGGWRTTASDRGSDINYESGSSGYAYNNIIVNCLTGLRVLSNPAAQWNLMQVGNNLTYGDTTNVLDQIYPTGKFLFAPSTDIPNPANWYPGYSNGASTITTTVLGLSYSAPTSLVGMNNPQFFNYSLPITTVNGSFREAFKQGNYVGSYDFRLKSTSPAIGKGYTGFTPLNATSAITNPAFKATVTPPNKDLGAFPTDGSGNQHISTILVTILSPIITASGTTLSITNAVAGLAYQWWIGSATAPTSIISNATLTSYIATTTGYYYVKATNNAYYGASAVSAGVYISVAGTNCNSCTITGLASNEITGLDVQIYPNPNAGSFTIVLPDGSSKTAVLINSQGVIVPNVSFKDGKNEISGLETGIYLFKVENIVKKICVTE
jgi:hypothetical protein